MAELEGIFKSSLTKNFRELRADKAEAINEDVETAYRRKVEDLCRDIRSLDRSRENIILNLAPSNITSNAVVPSDFDANDFLKKDIEIGIKRRTTIITLEVVLSRYEFLFGEYPDKAGILKVLPDWKYNEVTKED